MKEDWEEGSNSVKVDMEKAYDRINWEFLEKMLEVVSFEKNLRELIMFWIKSTKLSITWNGEKLTPITFERAWDKEIPYLSISLSYAWNYLGNKYTRLFEKEGGNQSKPLELSQASYISSL